MGIYDLPAEIDFILSHTKYENITYIGHSQGTTQFLMGASLLPEYFEPRVSLFIALAPVARLDHTLNSLMVYASQIYPLLT